ncbi:unnamed protein product [Durusdinium trenchii]|uniref:EF-hand domain-containing protein n=1 Tax=Durusdinium trenchii TaxID=1381693 RepID=A0ABP0RIG7_9DINO
MPFFFSPALSRRQKGSGSTSSVNATEAKQNASVQKKAHLKRTLSTIEKDSLRYKAGKVKPWMDDDGNVVWSKSRIIIGEWVLSQTFETIMGVIIATNICIMVVESNADASCYTWAVENNELEKMLEKCPHRSSSIWWLQVANIVLLVIYSVECMLRAFVERHNYLWNRWNQIDLLTVVLGWAGVVLAAAASFSGFQFNVLRITRVIRLLRAARVVISIPEFYILVSGLTSSFKAIIFGSVMLVSVIIVWAIIGVELLHPLNAGKIYPDTCWHCKDAFGSVQEAAVTIFKQIVAGDSWGEINEPLALEHPALIPLFFLHERATEARENDQARKLQKKDAEREANMVELALLCDSMDVNGNGSLSLQEMLDGYDHNHHFNNLMQEMDIRRSDIRTIFNVLDGDCSGEVSYVEFCQQLGTCRKRDPVMMHSLIKYSVMEVQKILNHEIMDTLNEHTEALIEQREMLMEQLQLLHALPVDPKIKEVAQKRRAARVLRRQGKKQGKPQYFDENGTAATAYSSHGSDVQEEGSGMVAHQVVNSMESTCQSFEELQSQMQSLIRSTEELSSKATNSKQDLLEPGTGTLLAVQTEDAQALSADRNERTTSLNEELERKFSLLLAKLRQRMDDEEVLQRRCKDAVQAVDSLLADHSGRYFYC